MKFSVFSQGNPFRQVTTGMAKGSLITGLILIGLGMLVWVLKEIFALIAMILFFMAGFSAIGYSARLFILQWKMKKQNNVYRQGVEVHFQDDHQNVDVHIQD